MVTNQTGANGMKLKMPLLGGMYYGYAHLQLPDLILHAYFEFVPLFSPRVQPKA